MSAGYEVPCVRFYGEPCDPENCCGGRNSKGEVTLRAQKENKPQLGPDEIELAWAAGLFDGEGSVVYGPQGRARKDGSRRIYPKLSIGNTDVRLLNRFRAAVGVGAVNGPYGRYDQHDKTREVKPIYQYTAAHKSGRVVAAKILPYLSPEKKERVEEAFGERV